jgi:hypothetical protein
VTKTMIMEYPDLNLCISATLLEEMNPELCEVIWNHLPMECVQEHAVVSGGSLYCWTPIVTTAPVRYREKLAEQPLGRVRYSQMTGNKIGMNYGPITEPLPHCIPIGQVIDDDLEKVKAVGKAVWDSIFYTKRIIRVHFKQGAED